MNDEELRRYIEAAASAPLLDRDVELQLASAAQEGDETAQDRLFSSHARLVLSIARSYVDSGLPLGSLVEAGDSGLWAALESFDPDKEFRFSSYATWCIRQRITRRIADTS